MYLEELLRSLVEGKIPSTSLRNKLPQSHLYPPFFLATGNIPSFWVKEEANFEAKFHPLLSGSPGAGHLTSLSVSVSEKWVIIPGPLYPT